MANFDSGVMKYIKTRATVEVGFPVDWKGSAEVCCKHCQFYYRSTQRCGLTQQVVNFPDRYVGECCPLEEVKENEI